MGLALLQSGGAVTTSLRISTANLKGNAVRRQYLQERGSPQA